MPPKGSSEPKPIVTKNSSEFKLESYASIPPGELVVFAVQVLQADGSPAMTEDIVSTCFRFFPHSFALKNYFYWPDSALVTRRLHDAREKGLLKGNPTDGFEVKVQGRKAAKATAKALGVSFPVPPKAEEPAPPVVETPVIEMKEEPEAPVKAAQSAAGDGGRSKARKKALKKQAVKKAGKPAVKKKPVKPAVVRKAAVKPKTKTAKPKAKQKQPAPKPKVEKRKAPVVKAQKRKTHVAKAIQPRARKAKTPKALKAKVARMISGITPPPVKAKIEKREAATAKVKVEKRRDEKAKPKSAKATQLALTLNPPPAKKKVQVPAARLKVREEAKPVTASKEEKEKAAKVVKQVERSDAFHHYKKNGRKADISEFDFRNMLFTTMESSPETLKRNVDTFRRYAGIKERADLIAFLDFCEGHFAALLKPKAKKAFRR